jgi:sec-independent protein translocase protein TatC
MKEVEEQKLIDHLLALRTTLIQCIVALALFFPVGFFAAPHAIDALVEWSFPETLGKLNYFSPMEVLIIRLKLGAALGAVLAFPYIAWRIWGFLLPALYDNERKILKASVFASTLLFVLGAAFCVFLILPAVMKFSASFIGENIQPVLGIENFLHLCLTLILAFGLMFQTPLVAMVAVKAGFVSVATLKHLRPYIIVGILILATLLTPPDVLSQLMLAVPTYLLFEIGLFVIALSEKKSDTL